MTAQERRKYDQSRYGPRFADEPKQQLVRPELPNNYDAAQKNSQGVPTTSPAQYQENNRRMYSLQPIPTMGKAVPRGWQAPTPMDSLAIGGQYGGAQGTGSTFSNLTGIPSASAPPSLQPGMAPTPMQRRPMSALGVSPAFAHDDIESSQPSWFQDAQSQASARAATLVPPSENTFQKHQRMAQEGTGGTRPISAARRYFWGTGRIDASGTPSAQNSRPAPVDFKDSPSGWTVY